MPQPVEQPAPEPEQVTLIPETVIPWRIAGEVLDTYIVCEDADKNVWLIDKHAAHERVNFDRFKAQSEPIMAQTLLTPLVAQLGAAEYAAVAERFDALRDLGFTCEDFGGNAVLLRDIPADIDEGDAVATLEEIADKLANGKHADPASARDALLRDYAQGVTVKLTDDHAIKSAYDEVAALLTSLGIEAE